jgi:2-iminobutanoate/2-iminopropanoate deaminase
MRQFNPDTIAAPVGAFSQAVEVPPNARRLYLSGQIGVDQEGKLGANAASQSQLVWENIKLILEDADMTLGDLVKVTAYLTDSTDLPAYGKVRTAFLGDNRPCSTLIYVPGLAHPDWKVEVEVVAAKVD